MEEIRLPLTAQHIKRLCGDVSYSRGNAYYRAGYVTRIERKGTASGLYAATVKGSARNRYEVEIELDGDKVQAVCDCPAYSPFLYCKHVAATLIALADREQVVRLPFVQTPAGPDRAPAPASAPWADDPLTRQVIQLFDRTQKPATAALPDPARDGEPRAMLDVEYTFQVSSGQGARQTISVGLKVGTQRLYVVQKLRDFLQHVRERTPMIFTKHFTYDPLEHDFREADWQALDLLIEAMQSENAYKSHFLTFSAYSARDDRTLLIPPAWWERLAPLIGSLRTRLEKGRTVYESLRFTEEPLPLRFRLDSSANGAYELNIEGLKELTLLEAYGCAAANGTMYAVDDAQMKRLTELRALFQHRPWTRLAIGTGQIGPFMDRVVRGLKQLGEVEISPAVSDRIVSPPLQAKLYLDYAQNRLLAMLEYVYGDVTISPFPDGESGPAPVEGDVILVRDVDRESRIMALLERSSFKFNGKQVYLDDEEDQYTFLYDILPELEREVEVFSTSAVRSLASPAHYRPRARLDVDGATNWLEVTFELEGLAEPDIRQLMRGLVEKKRYYRLPDGAFVSLEQQEFQEIGRLFEELGMRRSELSGSTLRLPAVRSFPLMDRFGRSPGVSLGRKIRQLWDNLRNPDNLDFPVPEPLEPVLREYQKYGYQWFKTLAHYGLGGILADDMGLGKTLQSIAFLLSESEEGRRAGTPALVVAPASLIYNWEREIRKFAPDLRTVVAAGQREERSSLMEDVPEADVWITSYPLLRRDIEAYERMTFRTLVLDEAQAIKNHASQTAQAVRRLNAVQRFALTGTPVENRLDDLWSIFDAVFPGLFDGRRAFAELPREKIARIVKPFILRRLKRDVLLELPDKIESVLLTELLLEQKQLYVAYLEKLQQEAARDLSAEGFQRSRMKILAGLTRLRQLCCHPSTFLEGYEGTSGKLEQLLELVEECAAGGKRMLIFSQFTSMLAIIRRELAARDRSFFYLDGETKAAERVDMCARFNDGERDLFLISLKAGGTGLNLTGADTVVLFDLWWNPAVEQQAADRAHRIGQKNVVQVIRLVAQGTIEEKMLELQQKKKDLIAEVIQPGEASVSSLTEEDIRELLNI